ncbi:MAG: PEP/pyruvate-binding domain-containing protein [Candidatus Lokiarchaeota archaeon]|nr:PEP/pyruvate-binding domain-containing protein [Candidatus Lokiarchaeota archaeon]
MKLLGGKGLNLFKIYDNGIRIPPCFILNTRAYTEAISKLQISKKIELFFSRSNPHKEVVNFSNNIKTEILNYNFPKEFNIELKQALSRFKESLGREITLAVRSSANIEDQVQFSFAGQAESFLFNNTLAQIIKSIKSCWASLFSPQSLLYILKIKQRGIELPAIEMAVIIQEMIDSDIAGVLFTINVLNNNANQMLINGSWGLCEAITNSSVIPDLIILDKNKFNVLNSKVGDKEIRCVKNPNGPFTIIVKNEPEIKKELCLQHEHLLKLHDLGLNIEKVFNYPQDIEWAFKNDILYALQSRPITNLSLKD